MGRDRCVLVSLDFLKGGTLVPFGFLGCFFVDTIKMEHVERFIAAPLFYGHWLIYIGSFKRRWNKLKGEYYGSFMIINDITEIAWLPGSADSERQSVGPSH